MTRLRDIYLLALLSLVAAPSLLAQSGQAELEVVVRDPAGLAVSGATAVLEDLGRGRELTGVSGADGSVRWLGLLPADYRLRVASEGFQATERDAIRLQTGERVALEIRLPLEGRSEALEVRASTPVLQTGRGGVATVVDSKLVLNAPLDGRNFVPLVATLPGVALPRGSAFPRLNGSRPRTNEYIYDGLSVLQPEPGQVAYYPILDAIEEFRVDLNSYSAEYGRSNGGVIQVRHKSGSNDFHGTLFEFLRHEKLNARNVFAAGGAKPSFRRNQFGYVLGGPIRRNRTFFFTEYQGSRLRTGRTLISAVPTALERQGDFSASSAAVYDPATTRNGPGGVERDLFANATVPLARIDPVAAAVLARYPAPNRPGANNYLRQASEAQDQDQLGLRIDHDVSSRHRVHGRWAHFWDTTSPVAPLPDGSGRIASGTLGDSHTRSNVLAAEHSWTIGPRALNQLRVGHTTRDFDSSMLRTGRSPLEALGLPGVPTSAFDDVLPTFAPDGYQQIGPSASSNVDFSTSVTQILETLSLIRGSHSVKLGADIRLQRLNMVQPANPTGSFRFTAPQTGLPSAPGSGSSVASLLLGQTQSFQIDWQERSLQPRAQNAELFVQDDWKAAQRLTLNFGLRYTMNAPSTEKRDQAALFDLDSQQLVFLGRDGESRSARRMHWGNFGPRFGLAWRAQDRLVVRAGYGLAWFEMAGITTPFTTPFFPFIQTLGESSLDNLSPAFRLADGPSVVPAPIGPDAGLGQGVFGVDRNHGSGYSQQWNFTLQRSFGSATSWQIGYIGSKVTSLGVPDGNLNQLTADQLSLGAALLENVANPFLGEIPASSSLGRETLTRAQLLKPWPRFTTVSLYRNNIGHSVYHGLQTSLERRFEAGLTFRVSYTFSKLIDDASSVFSASALTGPVANFSIADSRNRTLERDVSRGDIPQVLAASWVWEPKAADRLRGWKRSLLRNWKLGGIARLQSGIPVPVEQQPNYNAFAGFGSQRPNRLRDPNLPRDEQTTARYFDTSAFALAPQFTLGNSSRHPVRGPGWRTLDLMLGRTFALTERVGLEMRVQSFNVTNTPSWGDPNGSFGAKTFGSITSAGDPRVFEVAAKVRF
ncbi:MAG: carboxypeptidase regulatory-like domain-containing protein [Acidobacteria bacterium]|nr:carboxypeptidase regulatory-like domain-containing protein [Acidobacteriota bacterium]